MILSENSFQSYELIKEKENETKLTDKEYLLLNEVYSEITKRPISKGCEACILSAWKIIYNWKVRFYEETKKAHQTEVKAPVQTAKRKYNRKPKNNENS